MVIAVSNTITHNTACEKAVQQDEEIKEKVFDVLRSLDVDTENAWWDDNGQLVLSKNINNLKLHSLLLKMEGLGLDLKMTKQTLIEIC